MAHSVTCGRILMGFFQTTDWLMDYTTPGGVDKEGWQYATDFPASYNGKCGFTDCVRRLVSASDDSMLILEDREGHVLEKLGWVDSGFGCYILCLVLPGLKGNWQNWQSSWAR